MPIAKLRVSSVPISKPSLFFSRFVFHLFDFDFAFLSSPALRCRQKTLAVRWVSVRGRAATARATHSIAIFKKRFAKLMKYFDVCRVVLLTRCHVVSSIILLVFRKNRSVLRLASRQRRSA